MVPLFLAAVSEDSLRLTLIGLVFGLGGAVKGALGFGMPSVVMACLGLTMAPAQAAALLIVPAVITNVWQVFAGPAMWSVVRRFWVLLTAIVGGTALGVVVLGTRLGSGATVLLGTVLALYGIVGLANIRRTRPITTTPALALVVGLVTGLVNSATGISVMPLVPYLNSLQLDKDDLVQTLGWCFLLAMVALGLGLTLAARIELTWLEYVVPLVASLLGMAGGQSVRQRISGEKFRRYVFLALALMGSYMVIRSVG